MMADLSEILKKILGAGNKAPVIYIIRNRTIRDSNATGKESGYENHPE